MLGAPAIGQADTLPGLSAPTSGSNMNTLENLIAAESQEMALIEQAASTAIGAMGDSAKAGATAQ